MTLHLHGFAQKKYITKTATINFEGSVDTFEPIKAVNSSTTVVINENGDLAALVLIKGFKFPIALMQEHFNENYMESDDFPKAILRGNLTKFKSLTKNDTDQKVLFEGSLEMHGVKKELEFPVTISYKNSGYQLTANFKLDPTEYNIEIPSVVRKKIAETIDVKVNALLK